MSEAEIINQVGFMMEVTLAGISVFFTVVSAYVVALFYFLNKAPWLFKLSAFLFFTVTCLFLGVFTHGAQGHSQSLTDALIALKDSGQSLSPVGEAALIRATSRSEFYLWAIMWGGLGLIYLALFYFTFLHRWPRFRD